ncbi:hypothetical protein KA025_03450 [Candidatus Saccharibacteria bacterium]|nr:hypothetical protein [Candidatus Saccharibacteria bacterium]
MAQQDNSLTIEAPRQGIAASAHLGYADVRNLDIHSSPGVTRLNKILGKRSATTVTSAPKWLEPNPKNNAEEFALDGNGVPYYGTVNATSWAVLNGYSSTSTHGNGLKIWKDYLFVARDAHLDTFGPLTGVTFTASEANPMVITTSANHYLSIYDRVILYSTGHITSSGAVVFTNNGTAYYVASTPTGTTFTLSATSGGTELNSLGGTQSGTHTFKAWQKNSLTYWKQLQSDTSFQTMYISSNDGKLYGGSGRYVFSVDEASGQTFNPGNSATYSFNDQALDLPIDYRIKSISEIGSYLALGTWQGVLINDNPVADIFLWDRSSASFGQPIRIKDYGCHALLNDNGSLVCLVGLQGKILRCDGVNYTEIGRLPIELEPANGAYCEFYPGGIAKFKDRVFFSCGGSAALKGIGVYSIKQTGQGTVLVLEHLNSELNDGSTVGIKITCLAQISPTGLSIGFASDAATYGIDTTSSTYAYSTSYSGYYDTMLSKIGNPKSKGVLSSLELEFAKKLATGEGVRILYRYNLTDTFAELGTYTMDVAGTTKIGAESSFFAPISLKDSKVQFRIALLGATTTPELKEVRFS